MTEDRLLHQVHVKQSLGNFTVAINYQRYVYTKPV